MGKYTKVCNGFSGLRSRVAVVLFFMLFLHSLCIKNKTFIRMPKYAVILSGSSGFIVNSWDEAKKRTFGIANSYCKKFDTEEEANDYIKNKISKKRKRSLSEKPANETADDNNAFNNSNLNGNRFLDSFRSQIAIAKTEIYKLNNLLENENHFANTSILEKFQSFTNRSEKSLDRLSGKVVKYLIKQTISDTESNCSDDVDVPSAQKPAQKRKKTAENLNHNENSSFNINTDFRNDKASTSSLPHNFSSANIKVNNDGENDDLLYDSDGYVIVYTDGSCLSNGRSKAQAGIGVWFGPNCSLNVAEPLTGKQTNNNAEIHAATKAILQAKRVGVKKIRIYSDSKFMISCITEWLPKWKKNNWTLSNGEHVKNREQLEKLEAAVKTMDSVDWKYVKGHASSFGNQMADKLARDGAAKCV